MTKEIRAASLPLTRADDGQKVAGYAAVFDSLSQDLGGFKEKISRGAFQSSIGGDIRALWNHDSAAPLGRVSAGTLRLTEDERGLAFELDMPDTTLGRDLSALIARGDVNQMSFGFRVPKGGDTWEENGGALVRTLTNVDLLEVSLVTFPAYPATEAALRSLDVWKAEQIPEQNYDEERVRREIRLRLAMA